MSSTCLEPEGSSSGRQLYIQVWCNLFTCWNYNRGFYETDLYVWPSSWRLTLGFETRHHKNENTSLAKVHFFGLYCTIVGWVARSVWRLWLRAGRSGIESRWVRDFRPVQSGPGAHPASCKMGTGPFPGVKCGRGVLLTTHPLLVPRSWKSRAILLPALWTTPGR